MYAELWAIFDHGSGNIENQFTITVLRVLKADAATNVTKFWKHQPLRN